MNQPLVSIIVPCFNQAQFLSDALESVLQQTYKNWECIIVNDGSPDHTEEIANRWLIKDDRFKYVKIENGGLCNARNVGIENADGEFILPLDADDKIGNIYLELAVEQFNINTNIKVVYSNAKKFGIVNENWILKPFTLENLAKKNMLFCSAIYRKKEWKKVGGYDLKMKYGFEDWEFWINILKNGGGVIKLPEVCFFYRIKEKSMVKNLTNNELTYLFNYMSLKHADFFINHLGSFFKLEQNRIDDKRKFEKLLRSKKIAINILFKSIFGINLFKY